MSEREKFRISADYYPFCTGDLEKSSGTYEQWMKAYPRDIGRR